jgi:septal ring factor EnvC (AmiA/AmiB activator)
MRRDFPTAATVLVVALAAVPVSACDATADEDVAQVCDQAAQTRGQIEEIRSMNLGAATLDEIRAELLDLREDGQLLLAEVRDVAADLADDVERALAELDDAIDDLGDQPLVETRSTIQAALSELEQAVEQTVTDLDCP